MRDERINEIFSFIEKANIDLDYDPITRGPKFLNKQIATCRNLTNEVQKYERETATARLFLERTLNKLEASFQVQYDHALVNNPEIIKLPSSKDRDAAVNNLLSSLRAEIQESQSILTDIKHVEVVVQSKLKELKDINRDLRLQIKLVADEIMIGNSWGDQSGHNRNTLNNEDASLDSLIPDQDDIPSFNEEGEYTPEELFGDVESDEDYSDILQNIPEEVTDSFEDFIDINDFL